MRPWLAALAATAYGCTASGCSPYGNGAFSCANNDQCAPNGTCQPNSHCSFPDPDCASGQRYGDHQGGVSNVCVGEEPPPPIDGPVDMPPTIDASCMIGGLNLCGFQAGTPLNINGVDTLNTDNDPRCVTLSQAGGGPDVCLVYVTTVTVSAASTLRVIGGRPLYIVSQYDIVVAGTIDASSDRNGLEGAGANFSSCAIQSSPDNDAGGGGGAAGGSFHGKGGDGGGGDTDRSNNPDDGAAGGGSASNGSNTPPAFARGGCAGGRGGNGGGSNGGPGGGAVWLFANGTIDVRAGGGIDVTGAGADGGTVANAGSGGGGSGGYIKLIAPTLKIDGTLSANGGGGGEGGNGIAGGDFGGDGKLSASPAGGGNNNGSGGDGGQGSATSALDGGNASDGTSGGGGGGGGAGFIVLAGTRSGAGIITPDPL